MYKGIFMRSVFVFSSLVSGFLICPFNATAADLIIVKENEIFNPAKNEGASAAHKARLRAVEQLAKFGPIDSFAQVSNWQVNTIDFKSYDGYPMSSVYMGASFISKNAQFDEDWFITPFAVRGSITDYHCSKDSALGIDGMDLVTKDANFFCPKGAEIVKETATYVADRGSIFYCRVSATFKCNK